MCTRHLTSAVLVSDIPESLREIVLGVDFPGDSGVAPDVPPPWLDRDKFTRGQNFARKNFFSLAYAEVLSLIINFLFPGELEPLIFTRRSSSVYDAYERYLSTVSYKLENKNMWRSLSSPTLVTRRKKFRSLSQSLRLMSLLDKWSSTVTCHSHSLFAVPPSGSESHFEARTIFFYEAT